MSVGLQTKLKAYGASSENRITCQRKLQLYD